MTQDDLEYIWIISSDRDWDLLIQENVGRFSYVTRKEVTLDNWETHYDVSPEEYISLKFETYGPWYILQPHFAASIGF